MNLNLLISFATMAAEKSRWGGSHTKLNSDALPCMVTEVLRAAAADL
jgi:hypothetical protein